MQLQAVCAYSKTVIIGVLATHIDAYEIPTLLSM